mmetsp:Transcript_100948/g.308694  ORF Transcript_100948/g.308694 Transcript_100948/m.308694 type:complete len:248 (+) Transcript_100948:352-1095(+)
MGFLRQGAGPRRQLDRAARRPRHPEAAADRPAGLASASGRRGRARGPPRPRAAPRQARVVRALGRERFRRPGAERGRPGPRQALPQRRAVEGVRQEAANALHRRGAVAIVRHRWERPHHAGRVLQTLGPRGPHHAEVQAAGEEAAGAQAQVSPEARQRRRPLALRHRPVGRRAQGPAHALAPAGPGLRPGQQLEAEGARAVGGRRGGPGPLGRAGGVARGVGRRPDRRRPLVVGRVGCDVRLPGVRR